MCALLHGTERHLAANLHPDTGRTRGVPIGTFPCALGLNGPATSARQIDMVSEQRWLTMAGSARMDSVTFSGFTSSEGESFNHGTNDWMGLRDARFPTAATDHGVLNLMMKDCGDAKTTRRDHWT